VENILRSIGEIVTFIVIIRSPYLPIFPIIGIPKPDRQYISFLKDPAGIFINIPSSYPG